jgi:hypothetical protein
MNEGQTGQGSAVVRCYKGFFFYWKTNAGDWLIPGCFSRPTAEKEGGAYI